MNIPGTNQSRSQRKVNPWLMRMLATGPAALALAGCADSEVRTYQVPKEEAFQVAARHDHAPSGAQGLPHLHWESLPAGWQEMPRDGMRVANFQVHGPEGKMAEVAVIPLPGGHDIELESVNIWRQEELGLEPFTPEELAEAGLSVPVGESEGRLYDMASTEVQPGQKLQNRVLGVVLPREEALWFIKMTGEDEFVAAQKEAFIGFLKSLEFHGADAHSQPRMVSANSETVPVEASLPQWTVPENWQAKAPGSMVLASFDVSGASGGMANVSVSKLSGDGGGLLPNVNRWRRQVGLAPVSPAELGQQFTTIEVDSEQTPLVDLSGTDFRSGEPARMLVAVVSRNGESWYYKIMGDPAVVEEQKGTFIRFVQSAY